MSRPNTLIAPAALVLALLSPHPAHGETKPPTQLLSVEKYLDWETVSEPQISPDGSEVVYTRQWVDVMEDRWRSALWVVNADGTRNRFLTKGSGAQWSPDGSRIAYLAPGEPGETQIFVKWMDAEGAVTQITRVTEEPGDLRWSPDGKSLAFTMLAPRKDAWKVDLPAPPKGAKWTEPPRVIESRHYRQDRSGFMKEGYTHLYIVAADGGTPRKLTEGNWNVGGRPVGLSQGVGLSWTPDGREIVFDGLDEPDADARYLESHIYAVDVKTAKLRQITKTRGPWVNPVISRDGRWIAFTGYEWTPQTYRAEDLYLIGLDGTGMRKISGDLDRDPEDLHWAADGSGLYFTAADRGSNNVLFCPVNGGPRPVTQGAQTLSLASVSGSGIAAGVRSAPQEPGDIVVFDLAHPGSIKKVTQVNADVLEDVTLANVEEIWYRSTGGVSVQGWLVKPPDFDTTKRYPLILHIHGGPHAMYGVGFSYSFQQLAAAGYIVLYTNPRGSTGYGTDFGNAIDDNYPSVDYDDLMAGVDAAIARGGVDTSRLYVTGVSGGGVLSSWIIGHTDRFAAAAVRAPVIDWISFAGTTDIAAWGYYRFRGHFWENPDKWLDHSPLMYVGHVKTPTLLMTGVLDLRTPMGQTEEYFQALKEMKVPTAMVRFNDEYHGTGSKPSNFMRTQLYLIDWFEKHGGAKSTPPAAESR